MENAVDTLLDKIRLNCIYLTNKHINNYIYYKGASVWFETLKYALPCVARRPLK